MPVLPMDRLRHFARAAKFGHEFVHEDEVVSMVASSIPITKIPHDDESLLKLAVTTVAYLKELNRIVSGHADLDHRERAILDATLHYLQKEYAS